IEDARAFAEAGSAIAEKENTEREKRLAALVGASVPAAGPTGSPGEITEGVPGQRRDGQTREIGQLNDTDTVSGDVDKSAGESARPNLSVVRDEAGNGTDNGPENGLIVGLQAGADFLGINRDTFEKARQRRAINGEVRRGTQPAWTELDLREWRAQA